MRFSVQVKGIEEDRHQDEEHQFASLPNLLGTGSAAVAVRDVSCVRPAGFAEPKERYKLFSGRS